LEEVKFTMFSQDSERILGYRGDFRRWSLHAGKYSHEIVHSNQFCVRVKSSEGIFSKALSLSFPSWQCNSLSTPPGAFCIRWKGCLWSCHLELVALSDPSCLNSPQGSPSRESCLPCFVSSRMDCHHGACPWNQCHDLTAFSSVPAQVRGHLALTSVPLHCLQLCGVQSSMRCV
jgi:hypothetical protein